MNDRRAFLLTAGSAALTLATLGWKSSAALANTTPTPVATSLLLPLAGVFLFPPQPLFCNTQGEGVVLAGDIHVVTQVFWPADPGLGRTVNIYLNIAAAPCTGHASGSLYIGSGSAKLIGLAFPPDTVLCVPDFTLEPTNGCASVPLPLNVQLVFASDGTLLPESSVYPPEPL